MASKPLHVRRLQKALQEWVNNPALFQIPIVPSICPSENPFIQCNQRLLPLPSLPATLPRAVNSPESRPAYSPSPGAPENSCGSTTSQPNASPVHNNFSKIVLPPSPAAATPVTSTASRSFSPQSACPPSAGSSPGSVTSPVQLTPVLLDVHVQKLAAAAEKLSKHLPQLEPKPQNTKKKMCKDLELVMMMPESDPRRMEEIRKYAAIYGRFDCKRKPEKPLTLHEVSFQLLFVILMLIMVEELDKKFIGVGRYLPTYITSQIFNTYDTVCRLLPTEASRGPRAETADMMMTVMTIF